MLHWSYDCETTGQRFALWDYQDKLVPAPELGTLLKLSAEDQRSSSVYVFTWLQQHWGLQGKRHFTRMQYTQRHARLEVNFGNKQRRPTPLWETHHLGLQLQRRKFVRISTIVFGHITTRTSIARAHSHSAS